jgi:hypothetical protein
VPPSRTNWYANVDFDTKRSEIKKITLAGGAGETITVTADDKKPGEFDLENVPEKREADAFKLSRLATLIDGFSFQDVRKRSGAPAADARHVVADADGVRVTLTNVGNPTDGWVQVTAEPTVADGKPDKAKAITAKTADFEFRLPPQLTEILGWNLKDVTNEKAEGQPTPAGLAPGAPAASPMRIPGVPGARSIPGMPPIPGVPPIPEAAPKPEAPGADAAKPEATNTKPDAVHPTDAAPAAAPAKEETKDDAKPSESPAPPAATKP